MIGSSELALQREQPVAELQDVIAENLEDLRRLAIIVNDMLFLSQADRGATARRSPVTSLAAELVEIIEYHEAALHDRGLSAVCDGDAKGAFDVSLLRRALSNLLSNATRLLRSPAPTFGSRIESEGGRSRIWVENKGIPIEPEHLPRLFDRFYKAERSRRQVGTSHYGLGLAIVAAIARDAPRRTVRQIGGWRHRDRAGRTVEFSGSAAGVTVPYRQHKSKPIGFADAFDHGSGIGGAAHLARAEHGSERYTSWHRDDVGPLLDEVVTDWQAVCRRAIPTVAPRCTKAPQPVNPHKRCTHHRSPS